MTTPSAAPVELLQSHQAQIRRLVRRLVRRDDVDDVEQEVYVAALERPPRSLPAWRAWVATTIRNLAAKRLRGAARRDARERSVATPEPLPASDELVARLELEEFLLHCVHELPEPERAVLLLRFFEDQPTAAIASRLGLGESTVRARLQRAVERLRQQLDARAGSRNRWVRALAPWSAGSGAIGTAAGSTAALLKVLGIAATCVTAASLSFIAILAEKSPVVDAPFVLGMGEEPEGSTTTSSGLSAPAVAADRSAEPAPATATVAAPTDPFDSEAATLGPTGRLRVHVIDAVTGKPLPGGTVRALARTRFLEVGQPDQVIDVAVSAETWDLAVVREGYEPEMLGEVVVRPRETTDLGEVGLVRGTGVIEGRVNCDGFDSRSPHYIELRGEGRSPCAQCGPPNCLVCGYAWDRSVMPVDESGRFRFSGLAAGTYFLRPADQRPRLQPTLRVELARGEWKTAEVTIGPPLMIDFRMVDEHGEPFIGRWSDLEPEKAETIQVDLIVDGFATGFGVNADPEDLRRLVGPPPALDPPPQFGVAGVGRSTQILHWNARIDRARDDTSSLLPPSPETPGYGHLELGCARLAPNRYLVHDLPACLVHWKARCGGLVADELDVDLSDERQRGITLTFRPRDEGVASNTAR